MALVVDPLWYFAYGSNMSPAIFTGARGMRPLETRVGHLDGHRLCFNLPVGPGERGVANLELVEGARTCGVLYLLTPDEFDRLDRTEGVHAGLYSRLAVEVIDGAGARVPALTYRSSFASAGRKPSARYMGLLLEGARVHALPAEWLEVLAAFTLAVDERLRRPE